MNRRPDGHEDAEQQLRDLLENAVHDVEPRPGLDAIKSRTKVTPMSSRPWFLGVGAAVVATAATIMAFTVLGDDTRPTSGPAPADEPTKVAESPTLTDKAEPSEEPSRTTMAPTGAAVPVYYVGDTPQGPRLYREFHESAGGPAVEDAVSQAVATPPHDPDYRLVWPQPVNATAEVTDDLITVDVRSEHELRSRPAGMSRDVAELAVQQLVYSATAAAQATPGVQLLLNGQHTDQLLGVPVSEPLARADHLTTLALVMVTEPAQGSVVEGSFTAEGLANSFEATVPWQILDGDTVVKEGFSTAEGWMDKLYPWKTEPIDVSGLEPGEYTFVARTSDPSGGKEGTGPHEDTKTITVR